MTSAMAMAFTAGDKLKASAKELLKSLDALRKQGDQPEFSSTLESAMHKMFGSCTTGGEAALKSEPEEQLENGSKQQEQTPPSNNRLSESAAEREEEPLAQLGNMEVIPENYAYSGGHNTKAEYGEHIYEQLFRDDQQQQAPVKQRGTLRADDSAREQEPRETTTPQQVHPNIAVVSSSKVNPKLVFPASSPKQQEISPTRPTATTPLGEDHLIVPNRHDLEDDGISAVSAYTLEAMAQADKLKISPSSDSSLFPSSTRTPTVKQARSRTASPWGFHQRRRSELSRTSKTTQTTEDSSFEHNKWVHGEKDFWEQEVAAELVTPNSRAVKSRLRKSQGGGKSQASRRTNDHTASTASSTCYSSFAHPHETIPFEAADLRSPAQQNEEAVIGDTAFARDPDRIQQVMMLPVDVMDMAEI